MPTLSLETWALIRHDYEHTDKPVEDICAERGISSGTLRDRVRRWKWTPRWAPIPIEGPPPVVVTRSVEAVPLARMPLAEGDAHAQAPRVAADVPASPDVIGQRLQTAIARLLPAIGATLTKLAASVDHPREVERASRALHALTRTLRELNALIVQYPAASEDEPDDNAMRAELARKLEALIARRPKPESDVEEPAA